jgi:hypothetical protein
MWEKCKIFFKNYFALKVKGLKKKRERKTNRIPDKFAFCEEQKANFPE